MKDIGKTLTNAAKETFCNAEEFLFIWTQQQKLLMKPWFNKDCRTAWKKYHLAREMHNRHKTLENNVGKYSE